MIAGDRGRSPDSRRRSGGRRQPRRGWRTSPSSSGRWPRPASRSSREESGHAEIDETGPGRGARRSSACDAAWTPAEAFARPYVVSWNLTYRCNLACEHCYLDAGGKPLVGTENFADRSELGTEECFKVIDDIAAFAPEAVTILTGGEPLLRRDILEIVRRAAERGLWVVVGTNGVQITRERRAAPGGGRGPRAVPVARRARSRSARPLPAGARRLAEHGGGRRRSSTAPASPSSCRRPSARTTSASSKRSPTSRTSGSPPRSGTSTSSCRRGAGSSCRTSPRRSTTRCSPLSTGSSGSTRGRMLVNAKCAPHYIKTVLEHGEQRDPVPADGASSRSGSIPAGPAAAPRARTTWGSGRTATSRRARTCRSSRGHFAARSLADLWASSDLFTGIRQRTSLGGRCGECELNAQCGGCRARAYGMTGDVMAEDPLCTHTPGRFAGSPLLDAPCHRR